MPATIDQAPAASDAKGDATAAPHSTSEQDAWLKSALGLDVAQYAESAGGGDASGGGVGSWLAQRAKGAVNAVRGAFSSSPPPAFKPVQPQPPEDLATEQAGRSAKLLQSMPPEDQAKVNALLEKSAPSEKKYLLKAIASNHSAGEIETFSKAIAGKDQSWMDENLHVVGKSNGAPGIKQQWHDSCGPTTMQAMKAEMDPIFALKLRTDNTDITKVDTADGLKENKSMAEEQKSVLTSKGGKAVNRDDRGGAGMVLEGALNDQSGTTGVKFSTKAFDAANADPELAEIDKSLQSGVPVPLRLGNANGGHFVLTTAVDEGPPRVYSIHDPWDGKIVKVKDTDLKSGNFTIAGYSQVTHFFDPAPADGPGKPGS